MKDMYSLFVVTHVTGMLKSLLKKKERGMDMRRKFTVYASTKVVASVEDIEFLAQSEENRAILDEYPEGAFLVVYNTYAYDVDIESGWVCSTLDEARNIFDNYNYGRAILVKKPDNSWDIVDMKGYITSRDVAELLGIKVNRRKLSDDERMEKEHRSKVARAKRYIRNRLLDYVLPELGLAKYYAKPYYWWDKFEEECSEMIEYVDYWSEPEELNDINEDIHDEIAYNNFPDSWLMSHFERYARRR